MEKRQLCAPASRKTRAVFDWLCECYGKKIITAQQLHPYPVFHELDVIRQATGKQPAILALDFMDYSPNRACYGSKSCDMERAMDWSRRGGLITFCWHWNAPMHIIETPEFNWKNGFYTKASTFDLAAAMADEKSDEYRAIIRDIDAIAKLIGKLRYNNITVLWRPLHEASGGWFWWGNAGAENYKKLYRLMFERMTKIHCLDNLIWVWNGQDKDWYPGDDCVDIIGEDVYPEPRDCSPQLDRFLKAKSYTSAEKLITLSETGVIPDIDRCFSEGAPWLWCCPWYGNFVLEETADGRDFCYSEKNTPLEVIRKLYSDPRAVTLDNLPDFREVK